MVSFYYSKLQGRNNAGRLTVRHRGGGKRRKFINFPVNYLIFKKSLPSLKAFFVSKVASFTGSYPFYIFPKFDPFFLNSIDGANLTKLPDAHPRKYGLFFSPYRFNSKPQLVPSRFLPKPLFTYSIGQFVSCLSSTPNGSPKLCRSPGSGGLILRKRGTFATIKIPSGEIRRLSVFCYAYPLIPYDGVTLPFGLSTVSKFKAGYSRLLGIRPHVRGCAMNPVDHPHGGRTGDSRPSVSPWAQLTKGYRTRFSKINRKTVLLSVQDIKNRANNKTHLI